MSELSGMRIDEVLNLIEVMRAEMVPGGVSEGMLAAHLVGALEAYDGQQVAYERYFRQEGAAEAHGVGTHQG